MVLVVDAAARTGCGRELAEMHRVRKAVFVDQLNWRVPVVDNAFEIDQYDSNDAVYLIVTDREDGAHLGSVRLIPTTAPHILGDLFPQLCERDPPCAPHIWEISRLCTTPGLPRDRTMRVRHKLSAALIEFALLRGISRYVLVQNVAWTATLLAPGWTCLPLGLPTEIDGELLGAMAIEITPATLDMFRTRWGGQFPVLAFAAARAAQAA